jgi:transcriptional regulator with XRE-family HTH domain
MHGSLARKLRVLRAERGLSVREVEALSGVAKETISQSERGERHPLDRTLAKLARVYDVPLDELLEEPVQSPGKGSAPPETGQAKLELRSWAEFFGRFAKRWSEETQEYLAAGRGPIYWGLEKQCAAMSLIQTALEVPSIGGRDAVEVGLSREEEQAKLELSQAANELLRVADEAYEAQRSLEATQGGTPVPESLVSTQKRHLAALKSIA